MKHFFALLLIILLNYTCSAQCWQKISHGSGFAISIQSDGSLWSWGLNNYGQLGDGTNISRLQPMQVSDATNWASVSCGGSHVLAIKTDGTLWGWGYNYYGQIGDGTTNARAIPTQIGTDTNWQSIKTGRDFSLAIKTNGTLYAWGVNYQAQLGDGTTVPKNYPVQVGINSDWGSVEAGEFHSVGIKTNGTLWTWGVSNNGQAGNGTYLGTTTPTQVGAGTNWQKIACGSTASHILAIKSDGSLWGWGLNQSGQLGLGTNTPSVFIATRIGLDSDWETIATGGNFSFAIKTDHSLYLTGLNNYGQLGDGTVVSKNIFARLGNDNDWQYIVGGTYYSTAAIKTGGRMFAFGNNYQGQLGTVTTTNTSIPIAIGCTLSIMDYHKNDFTIFPNPVKDNLYIASLTFESISKIIVTDSTGKTVMKQSGNISCLPVQDLSEGIYMLQIIGKEKSQCVKFIKQ